MQTILLKWHNVLVTWVLFGLLALTAQAQAPAYEWATACGSGPEPYAWGPTKLVVDGQGNTYVAGTFNDTTLIGNTMLIATPSPSGASAGDAFVAKLDPQGRVLWATRAGGDWYDRIQGLALDAAGDAYVTGIFGSYSIGFGPAGGGGPVLYNASQYGDAFVARLDGATGQWRWARRAGGPWDDQGGGIAVSAAGEVYVAGSFAANAVAPASFGPFALASVGDADLFVAKLSGSGTWLWVRQTGGPGREAATDLLLDNAGALYVTGGFSGPSPYAVAFGTTTLRATLVAGSPVSTGGDLFVGKLDVAGNWLWAVQGDAVTGQNIAGIASFGSDGAGHLYVAGPYANQSVRLGPFVLPNVSVMRPPLVPGPPVPYTNNYHRDIFVARLDAATGVWQWATRTGDQLGDYVNALAVDPRGAVYIATPTNACNCTGFADPLATGPRAYLAQIGAANGQWRWASAANAGANAMALDASGRLHLGSTFYGPSLALGALTLAGAGSWRTTGYVARLAPTVLPVRSVAGTTAGLAVWPNPVAATGQVLWVQGASAGQAVGLFDALGRQVGGGIMPITGPIRLELRAGLPAGLYVVRTPSQSRKVVVE